MVSKEEIMTFYGRCRCCLEYGYMKSMWKEHIWDDDREIYGEMLMETFNITWDSDSSDEHICESCVTRLRDAYHFKKEVLAAEHMLQDDFDEDDHEIETLKEEFTDEEYDADASVKMEQGEDSKDFISTEVKAEYGEIEFLEEDAELVEQSVNVNTIDKDTEDAEDSEDAPKRKLPRNKRKHERSTYRKYTQNDLKKCIEAIQTQGLSQSEAARMFNIPTKTVNAKVQSLLKKNDDESKSQEVQKKENKKHRDNIRAVLTHTNATVIRGYSGIGYQCYFCPKHYPHPADLKKHALTHKNLAKNFKIVVVANYAVKVDITGLECKICHSNIDDFSLEKTIKHLKLHGKEVHTDIKNQILPFKFNTERLKCFICEETFSFFKLLAVHMNDHYPNYTCKECGKGFINKNAHRGHASRHIKGEFPCTKCEKIFSTQVRKRDHERVVHVLQNKTHKCNYCSEKFVDAVKKTHHEVSVHGVEPPKFCCQYCDKIYESQRSLTGHIRLCHLQIRPHECQHCQKRFSKNSLLRKHLVTHTGKSNFKCKICKKCYGDRSTLIKHSKTHSETGSHSKPDV